MTYGNGMQTSLTYDSKLLPTSYELTNFNPSGTIGTTYAYNNDGALKSVTSLEDSRFDRSFTYDHVGRIKEALTGNESHGGTTADGPYKQTYSYDVWGNTSTYIHREWSGSTITENSSNANNRNVYLGYNASGQIVSSQDGFQTYDAAGNAVGFGSHEYSTGWYAPSYETSTTFSGDKQPVKQVA